MKIRPLNLYEKIGLKVAAGFAIIVVGAMIVAPKLVSAPSTLSVLVGFLVLGLTCWASILVTWSVQRDVEDLINSKKKGN